MEGEEGEDDEGDPAHGGKDRARVRRRQAVAGDETYVFVGLSTSARKFITARPGFLRGLTRIVTGPGLSIWRRPTRTVVKSDQPFVAEIVPVISVDGRRIGNGRPGALTRKLLDAFRKLRTTDGVPVPYATVAR